jgi:hypothetical protein
MDKIVHRLTDIDVSLILEKMKSPAAWAGELQRLKFTKQ